MKSLLVVLFLFFTGCSMMNTPFQNVMVENKQAVSNLISKTNLKKDDVVIVTTIADINNLDKSSQFGRTLSEQVINELVNYGIRVKELKFANHVFIKRRTGEFILSRNIRKLAKDVNISYVVVGTYSKLPQSKTTYVNLKIIDPKTDIIIASSDYIAE